MVNVGAVILNWKDADSTHSSVEALQDSDLQKIYVVDNESDGTLNQLELGVEIIELVENRGFAAGVNRGIERALRDSMDYILVVNNDATIDSKSVERLINVLNNKSTVGIVGPSIKDTRTGQLSFGQYFLSSAKVEDISSPDDTPDFLTWACVLLRAELVEEVGYLDESFFMYWEDVEFGLRVQKSRWEVAVASDAVLHHATSSSHARAGYLIQMYSTAGLTTLGKAVNRKMRKWVFARVLARLFRAFLRLSWKEVFWVFSGIRIGLSATSPAYPRVISYAEKYKRLR